MNRSEYTPFVLSIWPLPGHPPYDLRHLSIASLGLIGECGEVAEVMQRGNDGEGDWEEQLIDECGDVAYYATVLAYWKGYTVEDIWPSVRPVDESPLMSVIDLVIKAKGVSEAMKKLFRDGKEVDPSFLRNQLRHLMGSLWQVLMVVDADLHDAIDANVVKLTERYAHKLS